MKNINQIVISIYGQKAVDIGYKYQNGKCYCGVYNQNKKIAQLEVVIDEPGQYNGFDQKWVDVTIIGRNFNRTLKQLSKMGFADCYALVCSENEYGYKTSDEVFIKI